MRAAALVLLTGCLVDPNPSGPGVIHIQPGAPSCASGCTGGMVCARDNACYDPAYVRAVHIDWTVRGQAASTTTCDPAWHLTLSVTAGARSPELAWAPVVCEQGRFTIDIIPRTYAAVALGDPAIGTSRATIDPTSGDARLDLGR